jgi:ATP-dependent Clp endopeptidase proteolytic subunit ClpP
MTHRFSQLLQLGVPRHAASRIAEASQTADRPSPRIDFRAQEDSDESEVLLYDFIGFDLFDEGWTAQKFAEELNRIKGTKKLTVRINSPGGDVWDGMAIYNMLSDFASETRVVIEGIAASAASLVAMAGDTVDAYETSQLMIHDAWTLVMGNAQELREVADVLDRIDGQIADVYAAQSGTPAKAWREIMDQDSYLTAQEAKDKGLVDTVIIAGEDKRKSQNSPRRSYKPKISILRAHVATSGES